MTEQMTRQDRAAAEAELMRSTESVFRDMYPDLFESFRRDSEYESDDHSSAPVDVLDPERSAAWIEDAERRHFVTKLAWMTEDEMADLNAEQRRAGEVVTYLSPEEQLAWRETPRPGPHMEVR